ncbi:hypothetical protein PENSPDRAFT_681114 [Peniophora sp. CONT]|nr:hypothetical protein PENSPDRAFT_681114 [Peniophora sp. CONT]
MPIASTAARDLTTRPIPPPPPRQTGCAQAGPSSSSGTRVRGEQSNLLVIGHGTTRPRALTGDYNVLVEDALPALAVTGLEIDAVNTGFGPAGGDAIPASATAIQTYDPSGTTSSLVLSSAASVSSQPPITTTESSGQTASQVISDHPSTTPHSTASVLSSASPSMPALTTPSSSETTMNSSHPAAVIGGAAGGGGVALLLLVVIVTLCVRRRRRRLSRPTVNDESVINDVAQYPISSPMEYTRKGGGAEIRIGNPNTDGAHSGLANPALDLRDTAVAASVPGQDDAPVLDLATASVMFRQLERFMRSLHGSNVQPVWTSEDDGDADSLPQYRSVAEL